MRARKLRKKILYKYLLINHHSPQEHAFTNLTVACRGNIGVLARQYSKNLRRVDSHLLEKVSFSERRKNPTVSGRPQKYSEDYIESLVPSKDEIK